MATPNLPLKFPRGQQVDRGPAMAQGDGDPGNTPQYPPDHQPGMAVPKGGSMCANCKYLADNRTDCTEPNFIAWNGVPEIPGEIDAYCSDWYMAKEGASGENSEPVISGQPS